MMGKGGPNMMGMPNPMMMMGKGMGGMAPMGMMRPPMPQQQPQMGKGGAPPQAGMPQQQASGTGLTAAALAAAPPGVQKQMLGEKLFPAVAKYQPELAGKITGMMLEMDNSELLILLESEGQMRIKVDEALRVLQSMGQ